MRIGLTGGSGFVGTALTRHFLNKGYKLFLFTRSQKAASDRDGVTYFSWDPSHLMVPDNVPEMDVWVNLAGASINKRWTNSYKKTILESRLQSAAAVQKMIQRQKTIKPILINASAIGYYGTSLKETFTEDDKREPTDFLSNVVNKWEAAAEECAPFCIRTVPIRFGLVLGKTGGALPKMLLPYKFFLGGRLGSGNQWVSWIHIDDLVRLIEFVISDPLLTGPVNGTAPAPVTMNEFGRAIAKVMDRPYFLTAPEIGIRLVLGEMSELLLKGQKVLPTQALKHNFTFLFSDIHKAVKDLII